jgi:hypothetical protein
MEDFNNVKTFLNYLKDDISIEINIFAEMCLDNELYKLIPIIEGEDLLANEYDELCEIINNNINNEELVLALSYSKTVPINAQDKIINYILTGNIKKLDKKNNNTLISNVLKNFKVSSSIIEKLFEYNHFACVNELYNHIPTKDVPSPYPLEVSDKICELYIDFLNTKSELSSYQKNMPFSCIYSLETIKCVLDNMPSDIELAEQVSTKLINSISLTEEQKNKLFDEYGYNLSEPIMNSTKYISEELYRSAVEGFFQIDNHTNYNIVQFFENAITNKALTETTQIDFINRLIDDTEKISEYTQKKLLLHLANHTTSPEVLHLILKNTEKTEIINKIIRNPFIAIEDLEEQAELCCNKIYSFVASFNERNKGCSKVEGFTDYLSLELKSEIEYLTQHLILTDNQYEKLIESGAYQLVLENHNVPQKYLNKTIKILEKTNRKEYICSSNYWLRNAMIHLTLLEGATCSSTQLNVALDYFSHATQCYKNNQPIELPFFVIPYVDILEDKNYCRNLCRGIKLALKRFNSQDFIDNPEEFVLNVKKHLKNCNKYRNKQLNIAQLQKQQRDNIFCFIHSSTTEKLLKLKKYSEKHCEINDLLQMKKDMDRTCEENNQR